MCILYIHTRMHTHTHTQNIEDALQLRSYSSSGRMIWRRQKEKGLSWDRKKSNKTYVGKRPLIKWAQLKWLTILELNFDKTKLEDARYAPMRNDELDETQDHNYLLKQEAAMHAKQINDYYIDYIRSSSWLVRTENFH